MIYGLPLMTTTWVSVKISSCLRIIPLGLIIENRISWFIRKITYEQVIPRDIFGPFFCFTLLLSLRLFYHLTIFLLFIFWLSHIYVVCFLYSGIFILHLSSIFICIISILVIYLILSIFLLTLGHYLTTCSILVRMHVLSLFFTHFSKLDFCGPFISCWVTLSNFVKFYSHLFAFQIFGM